MFVRVCICLVGLEPLLVFVCPLFPGAARSGELVARQARRSDMSKRDRGERVRGGRGVSVCAHAAGRATSTLAWQEPPILVDMLQTLFNPSQERAQECSTPSREAWAGRARARASWELEPKLARILRVASSGTDFNLCLTSNHSTSTLAGCHAARVPRARAGRRPSRPHSSPAPAPSCSLQPARLRPHLTNHSGTILSPQGHSRRRLQSCLT